MGILLCRFVKIIIFAAGIRSFAAGVEASLLLVFGRLKPTWERLCCWHSALCGRYGSIFASDIRPLVGGMEASLLLAFSRLRPVWERLRSWHSVVCGRRGSAFSAGIWSLEAGVGAFWLLLFIGLWLVRESVVYLYGGAWTWPGAAERSACR